MTFKKIKPWIKEIIRWDRVEDFVQVEEEKEFTRCTIYTERYVYYIRATDTYLGCVFDCRKPRAGEDWKRGGDLADGPFCYATWDKIKRDILGHELVKIAKKQQYMADTIEEVSDRQREEWAKIADAEEIKAELIKIAKKQQDMENTIEEGPELGSPKKFPRTKEPTTPPPPHLNPDCPQYWFLAT